MQYSSFRKSIVIILTITLVLTASSPAVAYADDLRVTNPGDNCIKYGDRTWLPVSNASGWYKYSINNNDVSARGGTHYLSDEQAKKYGLTGSGSVSSGSGTYKQKIISIKEVNIVRGAKVKSATAYKKSGKKAKITVKKGKSGFTSSDVKEALNINGSKGWIALSPVDSKGRAKRAITLIYDNTLPTEKRKSLSYNPPGWKNKQVNINGKKLWFYNRSHLVAFCLSGLNNEKKNLITGAVKFNAPTMSKIEVKVQKYVKDTDNAVLYEVTPIYKGGELVARGVQIRYKSIDLGNPDNNKIEGNVYLYNKNPGWKITHKTGTFKKAS